MTLSAQFPVWPMQVARLLTDKIVELLSGIDPVLGSIAFTTAFMALLFAFLIWHQSEERDIRKLWKYILIAGICAIALISLFGLLIIYSRSRSIIPPFN